MSDQVTAGQTTADRVPAQATAGERPLLSAVLNPDELAREIADERVTRRTHPTLPLSIYSYSRTCHIEVEGEQHMPMVMQMLIDLSGDRTKPSGCLH